MTYSTDITQELNHLSRSLPCASRHAPSCQLAPGPEMKRSVPGLPEKVWMSLSAGSQHLARDPDPKHGPRTSLRGARAAW